MPDKIFILNGPNLNLLGSREPEIYGTATLDDIKAQCQEKLDALGFAMEFMQSNHEGALIDAVQQAIQDKALGLIINPGAFGHTSVAIRDALIGFAGGKIEVHLSNVWKRETFRHHSTLSAVVDGVISGCGSRGYLLGIDYLATKG